MDKWKENPLTKEEEEEIVVDDTVACEDESFKRSLVGKLWTEDHFNVRIFKQVVSQSWRLKNPVEIQDLSKNLFLFRFTSKRDLEMVLRNGPWSFDRNLVILKRISGEEQPSDLEMFTAEFWARIYDLPLKLRSDAMALRLGNTIGQFVEADSKDGHRLGKFLRVKVSIDLRKPLKRGTVLNYQGKRLHVFFKYERLPNFCYMCGRIGHQMKDCEEVEGNEEDGYEDIEEKELPYGSWLKASPLPKISGDIKKEQSSSSCSKSLFGETSTSKVGSKEGLGKGLEIEVVSSLKKSNVVGEIDEIEETNRGKDQKEVECVAESLGNVAISTQKMATFDIGSHTKQKTPVKAPRKWSRKKGARKAKEPDQTQLIADLGKRQLVEVVISEGHPEAILGGEKKRRQEVEMIDTNLTEQKVVLAGQHRLDQ
ncbi:uncharacterized protein LOC123882497 [Trifolium pratense]|uniref:Uncharacterized protein n=1 Tax=Trifolium pratense TaxID=57577 RepID=A0ACB0JLC8_TRIPR|nr:uncharacterized protein LOC123882497 [Trifolium pratense]CAJ2644626.1 unnamed protein product [Trifolium pratense]